MEDKLLINRDLAQEIVDYLQRQPYRDVSGLIQRLMMLQPMPKAPEVMSNG